MGSFECKRHSECCNCNSQQYNPHAYPQAPSQGFVHNYQSQQFGLYYESINSIPSHLIDEKVAPKIMYLSKFGTPLFVPFDKPVSHSYSQAKINRGNQSDLTSLMIIIYLLAVAAIVACIIYFELYPHTL